MAKFGFSYSPERGLLEYFVADYWSIEDFRHFEMEFRKQLHQIEKDHKSYLVLSDARQFSVQSLEVSQAFTEFFEVHRSANRGRFAILTSSALNALQAKRAFPQGNVRVFSDVDEARKWLFDDNASHPGT